MNIDDALKNIFPACSKRPRYLPPEVGRAVDASERLLFVAMAQEGQAPELVEWAKANLVQVYASNYIANSEKAAGLRLEAFMADVTRSLKGELPKELPSPGRG